MSNKELNQDKEFDVLHKHYQREANELPSAELDAHILSAAHNAISHDASINIDSVQNKRAWYVPVSYVAILVISLSVFMKLAFEPQMEEVSYAEDDYRAAAPSTQSIQFSESADKLSRRLAVKERKQKNSESKKKMMMAKKSPKKIVKSLNVNKQMSHTELDESVVVTQKQQIEQLMMLYQANKFKELKLKLKEYRKVFPKDEERILLPKILRDWELARVE